MTDWYAQRNADKQTQKDDEVDYSKPQPPIKATHAKVNYVPIASILAYDQTNKKNQERPRQKPK